MLLSVLVVLVLLFAFARRRARIIRLRVERRPAVVTLGSWKALRGPPPRASVAVAG